MKTRSVLVSVVVGVAAAVGVGVGAASFGADDGRGEVVRVIDGDTLLALVDGDEVTVRLLNIDTPETKHPDEPVQCLGPEAAEFLTQRLPAGTEIELEYDTERTDRYGRTLAGVYESDSLVNAEIAAEGLGAPVLFEPNDRFLPLVQRASERAQERGVGLFAEDVECTLAGQLLALRVSLDEVPQAVEGDPVAALDAARTVVDDVGDFVEALTPRGLSGLGNEVLAGALTATHLDGIRDDAEKIQGRANGRRLTLQGAKAAFDEEQERLEEERLEREEQERQEQEEQEEREREEREEQAEPDRRDEGESKPERSKSSSSASGSGSSSDSSSSDPSSGSGAESSGGSGSSGRSGESGSSGGSSGSGCTPYGPEIAYSADGGYTGKRYGMPGGETFRKCS